MQEKWTRIHLPYFLIAEEILEWLNENCIMKYRLRPKGFNYKNYPPPHSIKFESAIDAMAFKLRWL